MSQKRVKRWFAGLFLAIALIAAGTILLFLLKPDLFIRDLEKHAGTLFPQESNIEVEIDSFSGNFFSGFKLTGVELNQDQRVLGYIGEIEAMPKLSAVFIEKIVLEILSIKNIRLDLDLWDQINFAGEVQSETENWPMTVKKLVVENMILNRNNKVVNILAEGDLEVIDGIYLWVDNAVINSDDLDDELLVSDTRISIIDGITRVKGSNFSTILADKTLSGSIDIIVSDLEDGSKRIVSSGDCLVNDIQFNDYFLSTIFSDDFVTLDSSWVNYNGGVVESKGWYAKAPNNWGLNSTLHNFSLSDGNLRFSSEGNIELQGFQGVDSTIASFALTGIDVNSFLFNSLKGSIYLANGLVQNTSDIDFSAENYAGTLTELWAQSINDLAISCKVSADEWVVSKLIEEFPEIRITGDGEFEYSRRKDGHEFQGIFTADSLNYKSISSGETTGDVQYAKSVGEAPVANINGLMADLTLGKKTFDESLFIITAGQGEIICEKLESHNIDGEFISVAGIISDSLKNFNISAFNGMLNTLEFQFDPFVLYERDKKYTLDQTAVSIGEGSIKLSGEFASNDDYQLTSNLENIDLKLMNDFFNFSQRFQGTANGDLQLSNFTDSPILYSDIVVSDGFFDELSFNKLIGKFTYRNNRLIFSDVYLDTQAGKASVAGLVTLGMDGSGKLNLTEKDSLAIEINLDDFRMNVLSRYVPWSLDTDGQVIGDISINGSPTSPKIIWNFNISDPVFDKISGESLTGQFVYERKKAYLKGVKLLTASGEYFASGYIPVNLDIVTENRKDFLGDPMDIMLTGTAAEFEFLTPYVELLDSISGDFSLQLSISGTYKNPIRNGQLIVKDGTMSVLPLTNSFYGINGFATVDNNEFIIKYLDGISRVESVDDDLWDSIKGIYRKMMKSGKKDIKESKFVIGGTMDLSSFFKPDFDISFTGDDLYFASSENIFRGIASPDLTITGRDTILVSGTITPSPYEFIITDEFDFEDSPDVVRKGNHAIIAYDIHVPLDDVILVKNSFIPEMEIDGDLNITSVGDDDTKFSGTLNILSGTFILSGTEFTDAEGTLFLDPSNIVPLVDIEAATLLNGDDYRLFFTGDLNNPVIEIREEDTGTFITPDEQNGILSLLIARESDAGLALDETGKNIFSNYLETEFEGFVSKYSPIDRFQVQSSKALLTDFNNADVNIYIGKNLTRKIYMDIRSDVFSDQITSEYEVGYRINRNMSIVGKLDENGLPHMNYRIKIKY